MIIFLFFQSNPKQSSEGNSDDIIKKLNILLNDKEFSFQIGKAGRKRASEYFSWERIAQNFVEILDSHSIRGKN